MTITGKSSSTGTHYWRAWKSGQIWNGSAYEDYLLANYASYDITATSEGLGIFTGSVPDDADFAELVYQSGGSPAAGDLVQWVEGIGVVRSALGMASANLDTQLTAIDDYLDSEVAAIKAKTDQLTFTVANQVDSNVTNSTDTAQLDAIQAKTDLITTGRVQYISHVHGQDITINQGETYSSTLNPLTITYASGDSWPTDLTAYTITLIATQTEDEDGNPPASPDTISQSGSVVVATGDTRAVRIDATAAQTAGYEAGLYDYYIKATTGSGGSTVDRLRQGQLRVIAD